MDKIMNDYLEKIDSYLRPLPVSDRVDIVKEIKSEMLELEMKKELTPEQILEKLGSPKALATAYLGDSISGTKAFSLRRFAIVTAFYSLTGISGMFVLPVTTVLAAGLTLCGVLTPLAALIKLAGHAIGYDLPYVSFQFGSYTLNPIAAFPVSIVTGLLLFFAGKGCWKLTLKYIQAVSAIKGKALDKDTAE